MIFVFRSNLDNKETVAMLRGEPERRGRLSGPSPLRVFDG